MWNYYRDEVNVDTNENSDDNYRISNEKTITFKSFAYKTKIVGNTPIDNNTLDIGVVVPLKYLSKFRRPLDFPLINCEKEIDLIMVKKLYNI